MNSKNLFRKVNIHFSEGKPLVVFKKPNDHWITAWLAASNDVFKDFTEVESGFIMAPFHNDKSAVIIPEVNCEILRSEISSSTVEAVPVSWKQQMNEAPSDYLAMIEKGIKTIKETELEKVVLSRVEVTEMKSDAISVFKSLAQKYPAAMVYLWHHPKYGTWLGATPESLMSIDTGRINTVSLAGTKSTGTGDNPKWTAKEFDEQAYVTKFLVEALKPLCDELLISEIETVRAGNLFHLRTRIRGTIKTDGYILGSLVKSIHPSPAICGTPRDMALEFIVENEAYDRKFYTGFLGTFNNKIGSVQLFVNLRCMELVNQKVLIYVGGGITKDSVATEEWIETVEKTKTMKAAIAF